jgi:hypothetical protein
MVPSATQRIVPNAALSSINAFKQDEDSYKMKGISKPHENDVLMGRGGKNNQHSGNERLREIARERCEDYCAATKKGKSEISRELVRRVREMTPPGRCVSATCWINIFLFFFQLTFTLLIAQVFAKGPRDLQVGGCWRRHRSGENQPSAARCHLASEWTRFEGSNKKGDEGERRKL